MTRKLWDLPQVLVEGWKVGFGIELLKAEILFHISITQSQLCEKQRKQYSTVFKPRLEYQTHIRKAYFT